MTSEPVYPTTRKVNCVDNYHGFMVSDPYRWLEDDGDPQRLAWIAAQKALTAEYLVQIPARQELRDRFDQLLRYPRYYDLYRRGPYLLFKKNDGLQKQLVLCVQHGVSGKPEVLIDPNAMNPDGTTRLTCFALSKDGKYLAYGLSEGGVDWEEYSIKEMGGGRDLPDRIQWVKVSTIAWRGHGFYYSRYPAPANPAHALSARNEYHQVWYHQIGTPQSADTLTYEDQAHPLRLHFVETTEDEVLVILSICDLGAERPGNALWLLESGQRQKRFTPIVPSFEDEFRLVDADERGLLLLTNRHAPNRRLVVIDPANPAERYWKELLPERNQPLELVRAVGGKLLATYRHDAAHGISVFDRAGKFENDIPLPGTGLTRIFQGERGDSDVLWSFTSFTTPPAIYRYDIGKRQSTLFRKPKVRFNAAHFETRHLLCPSTDGTSIPMFLVHRRDLQLDGTHPLLLQAYGGNGLAIGPSFDPLLIALLERGIVFAVAGLRGGGEYGDAWHRAGWRDKKQNVFDDCIAVAEWLQANGYTSRDRSALIGTSNGGLLVGAVMAQRPDLFKVALPGAGIMDMLRFQHFTLGWAWTSEYGSSDDPSMFPLLLSYSPLHNIKGGVIYPATLVTTYQDDDCVVPAHSFKFIATLQERGARGHPYLIRIESKSGHGAVSLPKELDERADLYAFLLNNLPAATDAPPSTVPALPSGAA